MPLQSDQPTRVIMPSAITPSRKVWMIIPSFSPIKGGAEIQAQRLSDWLIKHGWQIEVLTRRHRHDYPPDLSAHIVEEGIPVTRLYSRGNTRVGSVFYMLGGIWYLLRHGRHGIYHAHDIGAPGWLAVLARYLLAGKCLVKLRTGCFLYEQRFSSGLMRWQFVLLLRWVDCIIVVNGEVEDYLRTINLAQSKIVRLPNAVDASIFYHPIAEQKSIMRQKLGLVQNKTLILYVGRLTELKGIDILLRAWSQLSADTRAQTSLVLVGKGEEHQNLVQLGISLGVADSLIWTGERHEVRDYYWAADLFVLPSRVEGLSNAMLEAMACGLPVIASNVGGALDLIQDEANGLLFQSQNDTHLAAQLSMMLSKRENWGEMGQCAIRSVKEYASLDTIAQRLDALYQRLV